MQLFQFYLMRFTAMSQKVFINWRITSRWISLFYCHFLAPKLGYYVKTSRKNQTIGSYFSVYCTIEEGSLPVFFEWFKDSKPLKANPGFNYKIEISEMSSTFSIKKVNKNEQGNYTCAVKNPFGSDSQNVILNIKGLFHQMLIFCTKLIFAWISIIICKISNA